MKQLSIRQLFLTSLLILGLAACQPTELPADSAATHTSPPPAAPTDTLPPPTETFTLEPTDAPTDTSEPTPTLPPLGEEGNPIVWALPEVADSDTFQPALDEALAIMRDRTGLAVEAALVDEFDFSQIVELMCSGRAHFGALDAFGYIWANERGCADVYLSADMFSSAFYFSQILVRNDSGITSIEDLAGATFCRPDPFSYSGWMVPRLMMQAAGLDPENDLGEIIDAGAHDFVVWGIYDGDCDAGASFVDARDAVESELSDVKTVVNVLVQSIQIPNVSVSFSPQLPEEIRAALVDAFLYLDIFESGRVLNDLYAWSGVLLSGDDLFDPLRELIDAAGVEVETLVR